jgi:hypothetical protein
MLNPSMLVKCKDPLFTFPTLGQINSSIDQLIPLGLRFGNDMAIWVDDAATSNERTVILLPSFPCMYAVAGICIAPILIGKMMMEERFLFLPLIRAWVLRCEGSGVVSLLSVSP